MFRDPLARLKIGMPRFRIALCREEPLKCFSGIYTDLTLTKHSTGDDLEGDTTFQPPPQLWQTFPKPSH